MVKNGKIHILKVWNVSVVKGLHYFCLYMNRRGSGFSSKKGCFVTISDVHVWYIMQCHVPVKEIFETIL